MLAGRGEVNLDPGTVRGHIMDLSNGGHNAIA